MPLRRTAAQLLWDFNEATFIHSYLPTFPHQLRWAFPPSYTSSAGLSHSASPKLEFFSDRVEITSMGGLPYGVTQNDFFSGCSVPRNKEIMRVFRDLEIVEHLGSGVPRILEAYGKDVFEIRDSYIRIIFRKVESGPESRAESAESRPESAESRPESRPESGPESGLESGLESTSIAYRVLSSLKGGSRSKSEIAKVIGHNSISQKLNDRIRELLSDDLIERTIPEKPNSRLQKYRLTDKGLQTIEQRPNQ